MKKEITLKQWDDAGFKVITGWQDWCRESNNTAVAISGEDLVCAPNIGTMIEFLDEEMPISIMGHQSTWHGANWYWYSAKQPVELTLSAIEQATRKYQAKELADVLWQAVKEVLEK